MKLSGPEENQLSTNFYTLSTKADVLDYNRHEWYITSLTAFADFTQLNNLAKSKMKAEAEVKDNRIAVTNTSSVLAYQLELRLEDKSEEIIIPVTWDDNYISILSKVKWYNAFMISC